MKSLLSIIEAARKERKAVGHFNISTVDQLWAIYHAAKELGEPVVIGVSEGERDFIGVKQVVALVRSMREDGYPIFLNADHTYSINKVTEAIDAGFDAVIFDGAELSIEENIKRTKECVSYAREHGKGVIVEGELGYIGKSSQVLNEIPTGVDVSEEGLTTVQDARRFVEETGIHMFSPAIGSMHGMLRSGKDPDLNIKRLKEIGAEVSVPLVLHGASGLSNENIKEAIVGGVSLIHVSTELRVAWRRGVTKSLGEYPDEMAPYKILKEAHANVEAVVKDKIKLFSGK